MISRAYYQQAETIKKARSVRKAPGSEGWGSDGEPMLCKSKWLSSVWNRTRDEVNNFRIWNGERRLIFSSDKFISVLSVLRVLQMAMHCDRYSHKHSIISFSIVSLQFSNEFLSM